MSGFEPVQGLSPMRELRPDQDLAMMRAHEVVRFFGRQAIVRPAAGVSRADLPSVQPLPARYEVSSVDMTAPPVGAEPILPPGPSDRAETWIDRPRPVDRSTPSSAVSFDVSAVREGIDSADPPQELQDVTEPMSYGWDPVRLRQLVDWIIDGREQVPLPVVQRPAGDLNDRPSHTSSRDVVPPVSATERTD